MIWSQKNNSGLLLVNGFLLLLSAYITNANPTLPSVLSNSPECSKIGTDLLNKGGSAVDAAISTVLCDSLISLQGLAIGDGFVMKIWDSKEKTGSVLNAKEQPPAEKKTAGAKAMQVPGNIAGFWEVHQKYGKLTWAALFDDVIAIANKNSNLANSKLAETLTKVRDNGKDIFYTGEIAEELVKEVQAAGGITTLDDFKNYKPKWQSDITVPTKVEFVEKSDEKVPYAAVVGPDGLCVTVTSTDNNIPATAFKSESTGVILKEY